MDQVSLGLVTFTFAMGSLAHTLFSHGWRVKLAQPRDDSTLTNLENSPQIPVRLWTGLIANPLKKASAEPQRPL